MEQITVRLPTELIEELDRIAEESDRSRAEVIRDELDSVGDPDDLITECEQRIEYLETQVERLQRTNLKILEEREHSQELELHISEQKRRKEVGRVRAFWRDLFGWG